MQAVLIVMAFLAILVATGLSAHANLPEGGNTSIGVHGWIAMSHGTVSSLVCGVGRLLSTVATTASTRRHRSTVTGTRDQ